MSSNFKKKPLRDRKYLDWVREQPCIVTGREGHPDVMTVDPAHFRWGTDGSTSSKPSDFYVMPLIHSEHDKQGGGEVSYWLNEVNLNPQLLQEFIADALQFRYNEWKNKT